jgi:hypothetical protein
MQNDLLRVYAAQSTDLHAKLSGERWNYIMLFVWSAGLGLIGGVAMLQSTKTDGLAAILLGALGWPCVLSAAFLGLQTIRSILVAGKIRSMIPKLRVRRRARTPT